jgi:hypothetical protein
MQPLLKVMRKFGELSILLSRLRKDMTKLGSVAKFCPRKSYREFKPFSGGNGAIAEFG